MFFWLSSFYENLIGVVDCECEDCECEDWNIEMDMDWVLQVVRGGGAERKMWSWYIVMDSSHASFPFQFAMSQWWRQMFVRLSQALDILDPVLVTKCLGDRDRSIWRNPGSSVELFLSYSSFVMWQARS